MPAVITAWSSWEATLRRPAASSYEEATLSQDARDKPIESKPRPLEGIRVLDASTFLAGPHCATLFAEFGAEVIKIEMPGAGDSLRRLGKMVEGYSLWWRVEARNKKTATLDLRKPVGQDLFKRLVAISDVVVENFRPGTMEAWNLGWEQLREVNRGLVMVRISAFGQTGPLSKRPGFARIAHAFAGLTYLCGEPGRVPVMPGTASIADFLSGVYAAFGAMVALRHRDRTGEGQYIDLGLYESIFRILEDTAILYDQTGHVRQRLGSATENATPHNHYLCQDGEWIAVACTNDTMFQRLCRAMGRPELAQHPDYDTNAKRVARRAEVDKIVQDWLLTLPSQEALRILEENEVPNGPLYSIAGIFADEHYRAREDIIAVEDPKLGMVRMSNVVPRLSLTPGRVDFPGREVGQDNDEVYGRILGLSEAEMDRLREEGVI